MKTSVDAVERGCALHAQAQQVREGGDPIGARRLCERALRLLTGALGPRHPDVANVLLELAGTYHDRGDGGRAQDLCVRAPETLGGRCCGKDGDRLRFALSILIRLLPILAAGCFSRFEVTATTALPLDAIIVHP